MSMVGKFFLLPSLAVIIIVAIVVIAVFTVVILTRLITTPRIFAFTWKARLLPAGGPFSMSFRSELPESPHQLPWIE